MLLQHALQRRHCSSPSPPHCASTSFPLLLAPPPLPAAAAPWPPPPCAPRCLPSLVPPLGAGLQVISSRCGARSPRCRVSRRTGKATAGCRSRRGGITINHFVEARSSSSYTSSRVTTCSCDYQKSLDVLASRIVGIQSVCIRFNSVQYVAGSVSDVQRRNLKSWSPRDIQVSFLSFCGRRVHSIPLIESIVMVYLVFTVQILDCFPAVILRGNLSIVKVQIRDPQYNENCRFLSYLSVAAKNT